MAITQSKYVNEDLSQKLLITATALDTRFQDLDKERMENYNMMVSSMQISAKDKANLRKQGRSAYAFNIISNPIKVLSGLQKDNRKSIRVLGRTPDDDALKDIINSVMDWSANNTDEDFQISQAFLDAIIGKFGFVLQQWSFDTDPLGCEKLRRVNPFGIRMDLDTNDVMMSDCRYIFHTLWMDIDDVISQYARMDLDLAEQLLEEADQFLQDKPAKRNYLTTIWDKLRTAAGKFQKGEFREAYNQIMINNSTDAVFDPERGLFRVITAHERRTKRAFYHHSYLTGQVSDISSMVTDNSKRGYDQNKIAAFTERNPGIINSEYIKEIYCTSVIPAFQGLVLQDKPYPIQNGQYMYTPIFAYNFHADFSLTQSVVDEIKDPQHNLNKFKNAFIELVTKLIPKSVIAKPMAIKGFEKDWQDPKFVGIKRIDDSAEYGKDIQYEPTPQISPALMQIEQQEFQLVDKISGISPNAQGRKESSNESGVAVSQRIERSDLNTSHLFDNLDKACLMIGRNRLALIQKFMTTERVLRITTDNDQVQFLEVNKKTADRVINDLSIGQYDVTVTQEPRGRTAREIEFLKTNEVIKTVVTMVPQTAPQLAAIYVNASGIAAKKEISEAINQVLQAPAQQNPVLEQAQNEEIKQKLRGMDLDNDSKELDNAVKVQNLIDAQIQVPNINE